MQEILDTLEGWAKSKVPVPPGMWVDEALKLLSFYGEECDKLADLKTAVAREKWNFKNSALKITNADAESYKETLDLTNKLNKQDFLVKRIEEYIRTAKKRASLADTEMKY
jgi:hypothetical protein